MSFRLIGPGQRIECGRAQQQICNAADLLTLFPCVGGARTAIELDLSVTEGADILTGPWSGAARWWFEALDHRQFAVAGQHWTAQVAGIHMVRFDVWVQLDLAGVSPRSIVLHITRGMNVPDVLAAIESMIAVEAS